jgi:SP family sugar:H+ symporter-like MFS transporter
MAKLYGVPDNHRILADELAEIKEKHDEDLLHAGEKWWKIFVGPRMPYRLAVGITLQALQQLTGANYFFYYGTVIFKSTGINNVSCRSSTAWLPTLTSHNSHMSRR